MKTKNKADKIVSAMLEDQWMGGADDRAGAPGDMWRQGGFARPNLGAFTGKRAGETDDDTLLALLGHDDPSDELPLDPTAPPGPAAPPGPLPGPAAPPEIQPTSRFNWRPPVQ